MQYFRSLSQVPVGAAPSVVTIGNFDGVHLGHQSLINCVLSESSAHNLASYLVSFEPLPHAFFTNKPLSRLMSWREKFKVIKKTGIDNFLTIPFTQNFAKLTAEDFIKDILVATLNVRVVVVGDDFRFGYKRQGDANLLRKYADKYGYRIIEMPTLMLDSERISTSRTRIALENSDFVLAEKLLGRPYQVSGCVTYGDQIGRTLGFPTANICLRRRKMPLSGVFAAWVEWQGEQFRGAVHIGPRPVLGEQQAVLEVFLLDFSANLYGQHIHLSFVQKLRDISSFESLDSLKQQIQLDVEMARKINL